MLKEKAEIIRVTKAILEIIREGKFGLTYHLIDLKEDLEYLNSLARRIQ